MDDRICGPWSFSFVGSQEMATSLRVGAGSSIEFCIECKQLCKLLPAQRGRTAHRFLGQHSGDRVLASCHTPWKACVVVLRFRPNPRLASAFHQNLRLELDSQP